jgi:enoyl-CoA hydratase
MKSLNIREDYNVVILRSGCRHFSAGGDIDEIKEILSRKKDVDFGMSVSKIVAGAIESIINCKKPVIAAVNGKALGAGTAIAASCDVIIAEEDAEFGLPELSLGVIGALESLEFLMPRKLARSMV